MHDKVDITFICCDKNTYPNNSNNVFINKSESNIGSKSDGV